MDLSVYHLLVRAVEAQGKKYPPKHIYYTIKLMVKNIFVQLTIFMFSYFSIDPRHLLMNFSKMMTFFSLLAIQMSSQTRQNNLNGNLLHGLPTVEAMILIINIIKTIIIVINFFLFEFNDYNENIVLTFLTFCDF